MSLRIRTFLTPLLLTSIGACDTAVESAGATAWSGDLIATPAGAPGLEASVSAVSQGIHTEAVVQLDHAEPGVAYEWRIRSGTCEDPGEVVGGLASYPTLEASINGFDTAEALLNEALEPDGQYHATVAEAASMQVVSCGGLDRVG